MGQESSAGLNSALPEIYSPKVLRSRDLLQSNFQRQIAQIAKTLPLLAIRLFYRLGNKQQRELITHCFPEQPSFSPSIFAYLESEVWLKQRLSNCQLTQLSFIPEDVQNKFLSKRLSSTATKERESNFVYIYLFEQNTPKLDDHNDEYLLLWTNNSLSLQAQQDLVEQIQILQDYLASFQEFISAETKISELEKSVSTWEHQSRNYLALINLYAENLCLGLPEGIFQEQAQVISDTVKELREQVGSLLPYKQQKNLDLATYNLRDIFIESLNLLHPNLAEKKIEVHFPEQPVFLSVDKCQIKQVFDNLLSNAIVFSPEAGILSCRWQVFFNEVLIQICDQGTGLSSEDLRQVFTPFYSRRPGGTGLGLAISKKNILAHKGNIWVENLPGGGAQFSFTLPR